MAVNLSPIAGAGWQFFDNDGRPLSGGLLYTYQAGTSTPQATYTNNVGNVANSNPIVMDAAGRPPEEIWLTDSYAYKFVLKDANSVLIATWDNITGINSNFQAFALQDEKQTATQGQTVFTLTGFTYQPGTNSLAVFVNGSKQISGTNYSETSTTVATFADGLNVGDVVEFTTAVPVSTNPIDASQVTYVPAGTSAVSTNVQTKLRELVSFQDFGAIGDGVADDTQAIQDGIDYLASQGYGTIYSENGKTYRITDTINFNLGNSHEQKIVDFNGAIIEWNGATTGTPSIFYSINSQSVTITNFTIIGLSKAQIGIYLDSLQPTGCDQFVISNFRITDCDTAILLGSVGVGQNRVSDSEIFKFVIENCNAGIKTQSTNVDSIRISTGIIVCTKGIWLNRAGFIEAQNVTGYSCQEFIYVDGPTGPQSFISCQAEGGALVSPNFYRRTNYTTADTGSPTMLGCAIDLPIVLDSGGSIQSALSIVGGYFRGMTASQADMKINLIGTTLMSGATVTITGTNTRLYNQGSNILGTIVDTSKGGTLIANPGYANEPNGIIVQYGSTGLTAVNPNDVASISVSFPKTFPTNLISVVATTTSTGGTSIGGFVSYTSQTASGFTFIAENTAGVTQNCGVNWIAYGY